jgi:hypothetical protein
MNLLVKYHGSRAETLKQYNLPAFRGGPYDFSTGECEVDEKDGELLAKENPQGFSIIGPVKTKVVVSGQVKVDKPIKSASKK